MVEASRLLFEKATHGVRCHDLVHPWSPSCLAATASMFRSSVVGSYKFYLALYLVQIVLKGNKINEKYLRRQFKYYLLSGAFGLLVSTSFVTFNCILRKFLFARFYYYSTVYLPMFLAGVFIYCEPPHRRYLVVNLFFNLVLEYWVRTLEMKGVIRRSALKETLLFMFGSSYLFYLMRQEREKSKKMSFFWFFTPPKVNKEPVSNNGYIAGASDKFPSYCPHKERCKDYIFKGTLQMFLLGCAMTMLRTIVPRLGTPILALKSITSKHFMLGMFFGGYIGIYRLITCLLCRHYRKDSARHAIPAGFFAGAAFWFNPNLSISLASITSVLHILCGRMYDNKLIPEYLPLPELLYMFCQGLLFHARVMHPDMCPRYIVNLLNTVSGGKVNIIYSTFLKMLANC